jgi:hypothetical protein
MHTNKPSLSSKITLFRPFSKPKSDDSEKQLFNGRQRHHYRRDERAIQVRRTKGS